MTQPTAIQDWTTELFQSQELGVVRKRDKQIVNVKFTELFRQFRTADFINNEITLNGEACFLDSFQKKYEPVVLGVVKAGVGFDGTFTVDGVTYNANHEFTVNKGTNVAITITHDAASQVDTVVDSNANPYIPVNNVVTIPVSSALTVTITFKSKNPA